jgi:hypothetical protein
VRGTPRLWIISSVPLRLVMVQFERTREDSEHMKCTVSYLYVNQALKLYLHEHRSSFTLILMPRTQKNGKNTTLTPMFHLGVEPSSALHVGLTNHACAVPQGYGSHPLFLSALPWFNANAPGRTKKMGNPYQP